MLQIRKMIHEDLSHGLRLKEQAGWNQVEADWRRLFDLQPDGCFLAEHDGMPVGTVTTSRFGSVAWIAMMLVDEAFRGQGIGRRLMTRALEDLEQHEVRSVRLDATPMGRPLYESLGFVPETTFIRFGGIFRPGPGVPTSSSSFSTDHVQEVFTLDREVTGTDRSRLISRLIAEPTVSLRVIAEERDEPRALGYLLSRPGANARQIGPCIANEEAGRRLLADAGQKHAGESVVIDIPSNHEQAIAMAEALGLEPMRRFLRMGRGPRIIEDLTRLWASAGPEKG